MIITASRRLTKLKGDGEIYEQKEDYGWFYMRAFGHPMRKPLS